jgi:adenosine deaminase
VTFPKIELHVHLEGTVRLETLLEIAHRNDYPLSANTVEEVAKLYDYRDFAHFIEVWILTTNVLRTRDDFRQVVVAYAAEAAEHGAVYLEAIFSPGERVRRCVSWEDIFGGYCDGAEEGRELYGVEIRLTPDIYRGATSDEAEQVLEYPPEAYAPVFDRVRAEGLGSVPHAGEVAGPASARGARCPRRHPDPTRDSCGGRSCGVARGAPASPAAGGRSPVLDLDGRSGDVRHRPEPRVRDGRNARCRSAGGLQRRGRGRALRR